jgi:hypothetical protein
VDVAATSGKSRMNLAADRAIEALPRMQPEQPTGLQITDDGPLW